MGLGGAWTIEKLEVIKNYLDAYTTALKRQRFSLIYIDAFAGDGTVTLETPDREFRRVVDGSARLALESKTSNSTDWCSSSRTVSDVKS